MCYSKTNGEKGDRRMFKLKIMSQWRPVKQIGTQSRDLEEAKMIDSEKLGAATLK